MAYTREQLEKRIDDAGSCRYEFVRLAIDGDFGVLKKCIVRCLVDNYEWSAAVHDLVNGGNGCPQCSGKRRWTAEERIEQINELENIEFVSWVNGYDSSKSKANLMCSVDNYVWSATVCNIINNGHGCPQCSGKRRWTASDRIEQINSLENIEFLSWGGEYKNCYSKANVRCKVDNFVWSTSVNDLVNGGRGCPRCANGGYDQSKTGCLYALRSECGKYVKVGISNNPSQRHKKLEKYTPFSFSCIEQFEDDGSKIAAMERHFHSQYERAGFTGFDGATEWLICSDELLTELRSL